MMSVDIRLQQATRRRTACAVCRGVFLKKNIKRHMERQHGSDSVTCHPPNLSVLVDRRNGIFMCTKSPHAHYPLHVKVKVSCGTQHIYCESEECKEACTVAGRCNFASFQCPHVKSVAHAAVHPEPPLLERSVLDSLVAQNIVRSAVIDGLLDLQTKAAEADSPPVIWWQPSSISSDIYLSVFCTDVAYYCPLQRVIVHFSQLTGQFDCACCSRKRGCLHKKIALWYTAQFHGEMLTSNSGASDDGNEDDGVQTNVSAVQNNNSGSNKQVDYLIANCRIAVNVQGAPVPASITAIEPQLSLCPSCNNKLSRYVVTDHGKVFDTDHIVSGTGTCYT